MPGDIVVFGAPDYTGRLTAEALIARGCRPVLAGHSDERLARLASYLGGGLETRRGDVSRPETVAALVAEGDVLVSTVGPYVRWGDAAVDAAIASGAGYLDVCGEPPFLRRVFEHHGPSAERAGIPLLPAFGWESVPGNLAGALALEEGGVAAVRIDVGYFYDSAGGFSGGSRASLAGAAVLPGFAWRDGEIRTVRGAERFRRMPVRDQRRPAVSVGASEHFTLSHDFPRVREVNAYIGDFGAFSRAAHMLSVPGVAAARVPPLRALQAALAGRLTRPSSGGPDAGERSRSETYVVALAFDAGNEQVAEVHLEGADGYDLTAKLLAWGAEQTAAGRVTGAGALGPVGALGIASLEDGCRQAGIGRVAMEAASL